MPASGACDWAAPRGASVRVGRVRSASSRTSMEEQPGGRAHDRRQHRGEERSPCQPRRQLRNGHSRLELQRPEALARKAGSVTVNGSVTEVEQMLCPSGSRGVHCSTYSNGSRQHLNISFRVRPLGKVPASVLKAGSRGGPAKTVVDRTNSKFSGYNPKQFSDKGPVLLLNGIVGLNSRCVANGYPAKVVPDTDGSSSESGYTTPVASLAGPKGSAVASRQHLEPSSPDMGKKPPDVCSDEKRAQSSLEVASGEPPRKDLDVKPVSRRSEERPTRTKAATQAPLKEDTWTLFRPPPTFPVDNSSAKIVPKISYASKVKENLNKAVPEESLIKALPPAATEKQAQVPMSAVKSMPSASFSNGSLCVDGVGFFPGQSVPAVPVGGVLLAASLPVCENVAGVPNSSSSLTSPSAATCEQRKSGLFICPLPLSGLQPVLPSACLQDAAAAASQDSHKVLGDIFHNEWGLSFINEPNAGRQGAPGGSAAMGDVTFQAASEPSAPVLKPPSTSPVSQQDRRTSGRAPSGALKVCGPATALSDSRARTRPPESDPRGPDVGDTASLVSPCKERRLPSPTVPHDLGAHKKRAFDLKAAVIYHAKEIENILTLQKQDPKKVVVYSEAMDGAGP
ncbi:nuclear fragile X mental retardation-interacting protein 2-like isoform X2 [Arapaima gigas]